MRDEHDGRNDGVFRFRLSTEASDGAMTLEEYYRRSLRDFLTVVRLYSDGKPVIVDAFAFVDEPNRRVPILAQDPFAGPDDQR